MELTGDDYRALDEAELQHRYHHHDPQALGELWRRFQVPFHQQASRACPRDPELADECVARLAAWLALPKTQRQYDPRYSWYNYARLKLGGLIIDLFRERQRRPSHPAAGMEDWLEAPALSSDEEAGWSVLKNNLRPFLQFLASAQEPPPQSGPGQHPCPNLTPEEWLLLRLRHVQDMSLAEIARQIGLKTAAGVFKRLAQVIAKVQRHYGIPIAESEIS